MTETSMLLPIELQRQLGFIKDPTGQWLVHDEFVGLGDVTHHEFLPSQARVLTTGRRYEIGVREEDLAGLLELAKLVRPNVQTVETILNFWQNHPKFSASQNQDLICIGTQIEPTIIGFETEADSVIFAYDAAIESALSGRSYTEMLEDKRWYGDILTQIEKPGEGRTHFFYEDTSQNTTQAPPLALSKRPIPEITRAIELARAELDEAGYQDVEIDESETFKMNGIWLPYTGITYHRGGREIRRFTGYPLVSTDGKVDLNTHMHPLNYVNFRYKADPQ